MTDKNVILRQNITYNHAEFSASTFARSTPVERGELKRLCVGNIPESESVLERSTP